MNREEDGAIEAQQTSGMARFLPHTTRNIAESGEPLDMATTEPQPNIQRLAVTLRVNGIDHVLMLEPRRTPLDALRHDLHLNGTKQLHAAKCESDRCVWRSYQAR
jgi:hypothetical protein